MISPLPVSYTHLDVYKRQGKYYFLEQPTDGLVYDDTNNNNLVAFEITDQNHYAETSTPVTVSYTHLGV